MKLTIPYAGSERINCGISIQFDTTQQLKEKKFNSYNTMNNFKYIFSEEANSQMLYIIWFYLWHSGNVKTVRMGKRSVIIRQGSDDYKGAVQQNFRMLGLFFVVLWRWVNDSTNLSNPIKCYNTKINFTMWKFSKNLPEYSGKLRHNSGRLWKINLTILQIYDKLSLKD